MLKKKLAVALYFLKDTGSLRMTARSFGIALNTASNVVTEVSQAISSYLGPKYLHLLKEEECLMEKVAKFGMTQTFGCIDGTHIPIKCPSENSQDFFCYKQLFHQVYRLCVTIKACLWMLNVSGQEVSLMQKCQIRKQINAKLGSNYISDSCSRWGRDT